MLLALAVLAAAAALLTLRASRSEEPNVRLPLARRTAVLALVGALLLGGALAAAALEAQPESRSPAFGASASRLGSVDSNRYAYWRVALGTFADHPLQGIGSGAFVVDWLQERDVLDPTREPHSLYLGTLAELGLVGLAALLAFLGGVAVAARRLWRADPGLAAGPIAGLAVWAVHAGLDWDWEMPAVTLVALALAMALVAWSERPEPTPGEPGGLSSSLRASAARERAGSASRVTAASTPQASTLSGSRLTACSTAATTLVLPAGASEQRALEEQRARVGVEKACPLEQTLGLIHLRGRGIGQRGDLLGPLRQHHVAQGDRQIGEHHQGERRQDDPGEPSLRLAEAAGPDRAPGMGRAAQDARPGVEPLDRPFSQRGVNLAPEALAEDLGVEAARVLDTCLRDRCRAASNSDDGRGQLHRRRRPTSSP